MSVGTNLTFPVRYFTVVKGPTLFVSLTPTDNLGYRNDVERETAQDERTRGMKQKSNDAHARVYSTIYIALLLA